MAHGPRTIHLYRFGIDANIPRILGGAMSEKSEFPSKEYVALCIEHQEELRREWEPRVGDWYTHIYDQVLLVIGYSSEYLLAHLDKEMHVWFPTLGQLVRMVEEKGIDEFRYYGNWPMQGAKYGVSIQMSGGWECFTGPSPESAMFRAWLEVVKEEKW